MGAEDFSCYLAKYEFNDDIIPLAAETMASIAIDYLNRVSEMEFSWK